MELAGEVVDVGTGSVVDDEEFAHGASWATGGGVDGGGGGVVVWYFGCGLLR